MNQCTALAFNAKGQFRIITTQLEGRIWEARGRHLCLVPTQALADETTELLSFSKLSAEYHLCPEGWYQVRHKNGDLIFHGVQDGGVKNISQVFSL